MDGGPGWLLLVETLARHPLCAVMLQGSVKLLPCCGHHHPGYNSTGKPRLSPGPPLQPILPPHPPGSIGIQKPACLVRDSMCS